MEQSDGFQDHTSPKPRRKRETRDAVLTAAFGMPKAQTGMAAGKNHPNTYDNNSAKPLDDNPAFNM
jgi:hypothetical protein